MEGIVWICCRSAQTMRIRKWEQYVGVQTRFSGTNPLNEMRVFFPIFINGARATICFIILNFIIPAVLSEDYKPCILL